MSGTAQTQENPPSGSKAVYESPKLIAWGSITELTAGVNVPPYFDPDGFTFSATNP